MIQAAISENRYVQDILGQPEAVRRGLNSLDLSRLDPIADALRQGRFDRIILTGMGASFYSLYPVWLHLASAGFPAIWVDAAELIRAAAGLVGPKTLLIVASQSGRSAEIVVLLDQMTGVASSFLPAGLIAISNDPGSPLGRAARELERSRTGASALLLLNTEPEATPSTRTYLLTLAIGQLAAKLLVGGDLSRHWSDLEQTLTGIETYLQGWQMHMDRIGTALAGDDPHSAAGPMVLLGRGLSYTSAIAGALNLQEAGKVPALGLQAAEFRHGPVEMAGPSISTLIFGGPAGPERELNRKLLAEIQKTGGRVAWLVDLDDDVSLPLPESAGIGLPLAGIVPIQLLCVYLALQAGFIPGSFRHIGKVTETE